jgi:hypothetical protein
VCVLVQFEHLLFCTSPGSASVDMALCGQFVGTSTMFNCVTLEACQEDELCNVHRFGILKKG